MAEEVDRLLRGLPSYAPKGGGWTKPDPVPVPPNPTPTGTRTRPSLPPSPPLKRPQEPPRRAVDRKARGGVWLRVGLAGTVAVAMTQWPYASDCGFGLTGYLAAACAVIATGVWGSVFSWRGRMGFAHVVALAVVAWGATLWTRELLPRVGYARAEASWSCAAPASLEPPPVVREAPPR